LIYFYKHTQLLKTHVAMDGNIGIDVFNALTKRARRLQTQTRIAVSSLDTPWT
jgi:hypothetical protein